jgi:hypothetical protein
MCKYRLANLNALTVTSFGIRTLSHGPHLALNKPRKWRQTWARRWAANGRCTMPHGTRPRPQLLGYGFGQLRDMPPHKFYLCDRMNSTIGSNFREPNQSTGVQRVRGRIAWVGNSKNES